MSILIWIEMRHRRQMVMVWFCGYFYGILSGQLQHFKCLVISALYGIVLESLSGRAEQSHRVDLANEIISFKLAAKS